MEKSKVALEIVYDSSTHSVKTTSARSTLLLVCMFLCLVMFSLFTAGQMGCMDIAMDHKSFLRKEVTNISLVDSGC